MNSEKKIGLLGATGATAGAGYAYATDSGAVEGLNIAFQGLGAGGAIGVLTSGDARDAAIAEMNRKNFKGKFTGHGQAKLGALSGALIGQFGGALYAGEGIGDQAAGFALGTIGGAALGGAIGHLGKGGGAISKFTKPLGAKIKSTFNK